MVKLKVEDEYIEVDENLSDDLLAFVFDDHYIGTLAEVPARGGDEEAVEVVETNLNAAVVGDAVDGVAEILEEGDVTLQELGGTVDDILIGALEGGSVLLQRSLQLIEVLLQIRELTGKGISNEVGGLVNECLQRRVVIGNAR